MIEIYDIIRNIRKSRGFSQEYVAKRLRITQKAFSKIECGETHLNWEKLNHIATILNVNIWELVDTNKNHNQKISEGINLLEELIKKYEDRIKMLELKVSQLEKMNNLK